VVSVESFQAIQIIDQAAICLLLRRQVAHRLSVDSAFRKRYVRIDGADIRLKPTDHDLINIGPGWLSVLVKSSVIEKLEQGPE
jgi:hypothetical protein